MPRVDALDPAGAEEGVSAVVAAPTRGQGISDEIFQHCLDLAVSGNRAASRTAHKFIDAVEKVAPLDRVGPARQMELFLAAFEMTQRLIHAPYDISRSLVQSSVVVDVDVDVDIASQQAPQQSER